MYPIQNCRCNKPSSCCLAFHDFFQLRWRANLQWQLWQCTHRSACLCVMRNYRVGYKAIQIHVQYTTAWQWSTWDRALLGLTQVACIERWHSYRVTTMDRFHCTTWWHTHCDKIQSNDCPCIELHAWFILCVSWHIHNDARMEVFGYKYIGPVLNLVSLEQHACVYACVCVCVCMRVCVCWVVW